jgi:hypothetical protein
MQHVYKTADMLPFLGFLKYMFERYSYYLIFNELLMNFSQMMSSSLQKVLGRL